MTRIIKNIEFTEYSVTPRGIEVGGRVKEELTIYYFGCWSLSGHGMYHAGGRPVRDGEHATPWGYRDLDCGLCPGINHRHKAWQTPEVQIEGQANLTKKDGWTALSFWDRSTDHRMNSNSNFVAMGDFTFDEMIKLAKQYFPEIMGRFKFEIKVIT